MLLPAVILAVLAVAASAPQHTPTEVRDDGIDEIVPLITGGNLAVSGAFPSVVSIQTPTAPLNHCNGVIINPTHILTSCRCVFNDQNQLISPFFMGVIAGDLNIMTPTYRRITASVIRIYPHPQFNPQTGNNDIAVLRVANAFPSPHNTIDFAARNNRVLPVGLSCRVAGWGAPVATGANAHLAAQQRFIDQPILDRDACNAQNAHAGRVLENMLCAGALGVQPNAVCNGNLGAGLFCNDELTGILTFGLSCGKANQPAVFTQIRFFQQWINQQLTRTDIVPPGATIGNL